MDEKHEGKKSIAEEMAERARRMQQQRGWNAEQDIDDTPYGDDTSVSRVLSRPEGPARTFDMGKGIPIVSNAPHTRDDVVYYSDKSIRVTAQRISVAKGSYNLSQVIAVNIDEGVEQDEHQTRNNWANAASGDLLDLVLGVATSSSPATRMRYTVTICLNFGGTAIELDPQPVYVTNQKKVAQAVSDAIESAVRHGDDKP